MQLPSFVKVYLCVIILITIKRAHWVLARVQSLVAAQQEDKLHHISSHISYTSQVEL